MSPRMVNMIGVVLSLMLIGYIVHLVYTFHEYQEEQYAKCPSHVLVPDLDTGDLRCIKHSD